MLRWIYDKIRKDKLIRRLYYIKCWSVSIEYKIITNGLGLVEHVQWKVENVTIKWVDKGNFNGLRGKRIRSHWWKLFKMICE